MKEKNMTALISLFARSYHYKENMYWIFKDELASKILSKEEEQNIRDNMIKGIKFFNSNFEGTNEEILRYIVNNNLAPSVLGRSAFCEKKLKEEIKLGTKQYLVLASGYDTSAYKQEIKSVELDKKEIIDDKIERIKRAGISNNNVTYIGTDFTKKDWINDLTNSKYDKNIKTFCSLLGISYYLTKEEFFDLLNELSKVLISGSAIVYDYPTYTETDKDNKISELANGANEEMKSKYSLKELENELSKRGLLIYEHLNDKDITKEYFYDYNTLHPNNKIIASMGVNYCLVVKK